ncbi:MAG TPA: hypothetical protein VGS22_05070 [Thermoanaerobaculia bacterium]|jgi:hypothetical protein|nr:hypothetical protein [Thermoanaerobaculia bacterium]
MILRRPAGTPAGRGRSINRACPRAGGEGTLQSRRKSLQGPVRKSIRRSVLLLIGLAACRATAPAPPSPSPTAGAAELARPGPARSERRDAAPLYLFYAYQGFLRDELDETDPKDSSRWAKGALSAAALARNGFPGAAADAARWTEAALDDCAAAGSFRCQNTQLTLERLILQFPNVLPPALRERLRKTASAGAAPPGPQQIADPWRFAETENQRVVQAARSLVAEVVAGRIDSASASGWNDYLLAFFAAHEREGWYEAESPGYLAISITAVLQIADFAPGEELRSAARRQLDRLFLAWAREQAAGFPAGAKSRTYVHWALGATNTPWQAWAWLLAGIGDPQQIRFVDAPQLAVSGYRPPAEAVKALAQRRFQPPYEIRSRRTLRTGTRRPLDLSRTSWATPDYILGAAQSIAGLSIGVSGGQEIVAALFPEGEGFAPLYLWSRNRNPHEDRWKSWVGQDFALAERNRVLARLGRAGEGSDPGDLGHAYLAPGWSRPRKVSAQVVVARRGPVYAALVTAGGWQVARAAARFPEYFGGDPAYRDAWVAVPDVQPASIALIVGRRAEDGDFAQFAAAVAVRASLRVAGREIELEEIGAERLAFSPGEYAFVGGRRIDPARK